jgi:hypothetical protein
LYPSYANSSVPKWVTTSFSMGTRSPFLAFFCDTKPNFNLHRYNLARCGFPRFVSPCVLLTNHPNSDWLIGNATTQSSLIPTATLKNGTTYSGQSSYGGYVYQTNVQYVSGYLSNSSNGINHYLSVGANGTNAVDGLVAQMNVKILTNPVSGSSKTSSCVFFHLF